MATALTQTELIRLVQRVFTPTAEDRALAIIVDLPDAKLPDNDDWRLRREMAAEWVRLLADGREELGFERVDLAWYRNAGGNNADLPATFVYGGDGAVFGDADALKDLPGHPFAELFESHSIVMAPTELSATAPLKVASRGGAFRAATMPGFLPSMIPALKIDYTEVNRRVFLLKQLCDEATSARIILTADGTAHELTLDLRHNRGHASGGLFPTNGVAGNLPSGEAYIVPYEGERPGDASLSAGMLPVEIEGEVVLYRIEGNRAVEVRTTGPQSEIEAARIVDEPAYANLSELGLGVLGDFGLRAVGSILLDEKLGLHIAFGRSDHFGGSVGPQHFTSPEAVIHLDRVYIPDQQPQVDVTEVCLRGPSGDHTIIADGQYGRQIVDPDRS